MTGSFRFANRSEHGLGAGHVTATYTTPEPVFRHAASKYVLSHLRVLPRSSQHIQDQAPEGVWREVEVGLTTAADEGVIQSRSQVSGASSARPLHWSTPCPPHAKPHARTHGGGVPRGINGTRAPPEGPGLLQPREAGVNRSEPDCLTRSVWTSCAETHRLAWSGRVRKTPRRLTRSPRWFSGVSGPGNPPLHLCHPQRVTSARPKERPAARHVSSSRRPPELSDPSSAISTS